MWKINSFLCFNLYTGGILIGWISLLSCIVGILYCIFLVSHIDLVVEFVMDISEMDKDMIHPESSQLKSCEYELICFDT